MNAKVGEAILGLIIAGVALGKAIYDSVKTA